MKRIMALLLAFIMVFGTISPAFAAGLSQNPTDVIEVEGTTEDGVARVTLALPRTQTSNLPSFRMMRTQGFQALQANPTAEAEFQETYVELDVSFKWLDGANSAEAFKKVFGQETINVKLSKQDGSDAQYYPINKDTSKITFPKPVLQQDIVDGKYEVAAELGSDQDNIIMKIVIVQDNPRGPVIEPSEPRGTKAKLTFTQVRNSQFLVETYNADKEMVSNPTTTDSKIKLSNLTRRNEKDIPATTEVQKFINRIFARNAKDFRKELKFEVTNLNEDGYVVDGEKLYKPEITVDPNGYEPTKITLREKGKTAAELLENKLDPQDISVWVGDNINWKDGVKLKDDVEDNDGKLQELLDKATVTDATDSERNSDKVGEYPGTLKVVFEDKSELTVENQNLYVREENEDITDDNKDWPTPEDAMEITFKFDEGIKTFENEDGEEPEEAVNEIKRLSKLNKTLRTKDFPAVIKKDGYQDPVTWKGNLANDPNNYTVSKENNLFIASATKTPAVCKDPEDLKSAFEEAANAKFDSIKSKKGVYSAEYDAEKHKVTVTILDKTQKFKELKGTGLVAGLFDLKENNNVVAVQIGAQDRINLPDELTMNDFALLVSAGIGTELNNQGVPNLQTLEDFAGKTVAVKLYVKEDGCDNETSVTYYITGQLNDSDKDVIPYEPTDPENPTNPEDKNIPEKDEDDKDIVQKDFVRVAFTVDPNPSGTLTLGKIKEKSAISALVRITKPLKKWADVKLPTTNDTDDYKFLKWEMPTNTVVADGDIAVAKFIKNGDKIDPNDTLPEGVHKVTLKQGEGVEDNEKFATYAVFDGKTLEEAGITFDPVAKEGFNSPAWFDGEDKVENLGEVVVTEDKTFEAKANALVCLASDKLKEQFEAVANEKFADVESKDGVYEATFDEAKHQIAIKLIGKDNKVKEIKGTGLVAGLFDLWKNHNLYSIQIDNTEELPLTQTLETVDEEKQMTFMKVLVGSKLAEAAKAKVGKDVKTFEDLDGVELTLTVKVKEDGCDNAVSLVYNLKIDLQKDIVPQEGEEKPEVPENFVIVEFLPGTNGTLTGTTKYWVNPEAGKTNADLTEPTVKANVGYEVADPKWNPEFVETKEITGPATYTAQYTKLEDIIPGHNDDGNEVEKPEGYVTVRFLVNKNGTLDGETVFYVNPEAQKTMKEITAPTIKVKDEYIEKGYKVGNPEWEPDFTDDDTPITADRYYVANFDCDHTNPNEFEISYISGNPDGGSVAPASETVATDVNAEDEAGKIKGSEATANEGYKFVKWIDTEGKEVSTDAKLVPKERKAATYIAVFEKEEDKVEPPTPAEEYTVVFNGNGGTPTTQTKTAKDGEVIEIEGVETPTAEGYTFGGWFTDKEGTKPYDFKTPVKGDITLYAKWTKNPVTPPTPEKPYDPGYRYEPSPGYLKDNISSSEDQHKDPEYRELDVFSLYMIGNENHMFMPNKGITRAEMAQIFARALRYDGYERRGDYNPYSDLNTNAWYYDAVITTTEAGVFRGTDLGTFEPTREITKAELIATIARFQQLANKEGNTFNMRANHWARPEVEAAFQEGWLDIYTNGTVAFDADMVITRAEVATILNRAFGRIADVEYIDNNIESLVRFDDVSRDDWFYYDVIVATNTYATYGREWVNHSDGMDNEFTHVDAIKWIKDLRNDKEVVETLRRVKFQRNAR